MPAPSTDLVRRYRELPFPSGHLGDCPENYLKCQLLSAMGTHANEPAVSQLLLDILASPGEFDLVRIDAAKTVGLDVSDNSPLVRELKGQLWQTVSNRDENLLVRQQAAQCLEFGFGGEAEPAIVEQILFDDDDDLDVRHGLLIYLKSPGAGPLVKDLLPRLRNHDYWSQFDQALDAIAGESQS